LTKSEDVFRTLSPGFVSGVLANLFFLNLFFSIMIGLVMILCTVIALKFRLFNYLSRVFQREATIASVFVFDGQKVLLVRDADRDTPWFVPPSAHVRCSSKGGPHRSVLEQLQKETGLDVRIDARDKLGADRGSEPSALPIFARREEPSPREGHSVHYDFYYLGYVHGPAEIKDAKGDYAWIEVQDLVKSQVRAPGDIRKMVPVAFKLWQQQIGPF
jgi:hypothetical protein